MLGTSASAAPVGVAETINKIQAAQKKAEDAAKIVQSATETAIATAEQEKINEALREAENLANNIESATDTDTAQKAEVTTAITAIKKAQTEAEATVNKLLSSTSKTSDSSPAAKPVGTAAPKTDPDTSAKTTANKWHLGKPQQEATAKKLAEILKIDAAKITFKEEKLAAADPNKKDVFHTLVEIHGAPKPVTVLDFHCGKSLDTAENWRNAFPGKNASEQNELMAQIMLAQFVAMNPHFKGEIPLTCRKDYEGNALFQAIKKVVGEKAEYKDLTVPDPDKKTLELEPDAAIKTPSSSPLKKSEEEDESDVLPAFPSSVGLSS